jgi:hypothetical protein
MKDAYENAIALLLDGHKINNPKAKCLGINNESYSQLQLIEGGNSEKNLPPQIQKDRLLQRQQGMEKPPLPLMYLRTFLAQRQHK